MSIRLVAKKIDKDNFTIAIRSAGFGDDSGKPAENIHSTRLAPPQYPENAARAGVAASAYLLVKVGRDGKVMDAIAEQVNLKIVSDERSMDRWRKVFADTSLSRARQWTFQPPTEGEDADDAFWVVRVPVLFSLDGGRQPQPYGRWEAYVPGPRQSDPWGEDRDGAAFNPDTLAPGGVYLAGSGLRLLTELSGS
jgi:hypothetical protein